MSQETQSNFYCYKNDSKKFQNTPPALKTPGAAQQPLYFKKGYTSVSRWVHQAQLHPKSDNSQTSGTLVLGCGPLPVIQGKDNLAGSSMQATLSR